MKTLIVLPLILLVNLCTPRAPDLAEPELIKSFLNVTDFQLLVESDSLPSDGKSMAIIKLKVGANFVRKMDNKEVTFTLPINSTGATFLPSGSEVKTSVDSNGEAFAYIVSQTDGVVTVQVTATVSGDTYSKSEAVKFYKASKSTYTSTVQQNDIEADNLSYAIIKVHITNPDPSKSVVFSTDRGTFANNSKTFSGNIPLNGLVQASLRNSRPENASVTISVANLYTEQLSVRFVTAYPELVLIEPVLTTLSASARSSTKIIARLKRTVGAVSEGQLVTFFDSTATGTKVGLFSNLTTSNNSGDVEVDYVLHDTSYRGVVYIKGYVVSATGKRILGETRILVHE